MPEYCVIQYETCRRCKGTGMALPAVWEHQNPWRSGHELQKCPDCQDEGKQRSEIRLRDALKELLREVLEGFLQ